jgi:hypothetical protein
MYRCTTPTAHLIHQKKGEGMAQAKIQERVWVERAQHWKRSTFIPVFESVKLGGNMLF